MPADRSTYFCHIQKLDDLAKTKSHIIRFEPIISNPGRIHHIEVFHCDLDAKTEVPLYDGSCMAIPKESDVCYRVMAIWAIGASTFVYPDEAGFPVGGENYNPFFRIEIHFDNPELRGGEF